MTSSPSPPEDAFRELFAQNFRELLGYALRRCGSPDDAADVVADTMLVAWRRFDQVPTDGTARLWLYGVARRVLANHRRGAQRRDRLGERLRVELQDVVPDHAGDVEANAVVMAAMAGLSETDRELIMLTTWENLNPQEAAVVLDVPARVVRTRLHRARGRLRNLLGDAYGDRGHEREERTLRPVQEKR
ncbi:RNA polymerase sigma factor [Kribbella antibiotica]|uniref:RNA polymerase sigma factor n=1 Tax=Kribbella antibiotica TaxID=190195 RepID=A0A4V2YPG7_9ACTN|nr:RNA polymerase sigma factor [Kribbella antibiotica]TDD58177.1 RNA polymerase sigma factor [Kribbella antibiotica]